MKAAVVIGSRGSRLALVQANLVCSLLKDRNPGLQVTIRKIVTEGDRNRTVALEDVPEIGMFTRRLEDALLSRDIDLAVHSFKDLPTDTAPGLSLIATTEREDPRDVLVANSSLGDLPPGARIGTGSPRRAVQFLCMRPDLQVTAIRGNVDTRLRRVASGDIDGVILAAAGLSRLGWKDKVTDYLPVTRFLPAVGQGALALEARTGDADTQALVSTINHLLTWQGVRAERAFLKGLGGGCRAPIAALGVVKRDTLHLEGMVADVPTRRILRAEEKGPAESPEEIGSRLAKRLLEMGGAEFVTETRLQ